MRNILYKGFVIDPSVELVPSITISPFSLSFDTISITTQMNGGGRLSETVGRDYKLFPKCRSAIHAAISYYTLQPDDMVSIFTTSGNTYISSCVTKIIEKTCKWSMQIEEKTKVIFVNHEFGYPYQNIEELKKYKLPIIEDAAHAFFTKDENIGKVGDFVVYSLPKAFPMQLGGILTSPKGFDCNIGETASKAVENYIKVNFSNASKRMLNTVKKRIGNYFYLKEKLDSLGIEPYFFDSKSMLMQSCHQCSCSNGMMIWTIQN